SSSRRHTRSKRDWSSDVCSSDLPGPQTYHPGRIFTPAQALEGLTFGPAVAGDFGDGVGELAPGGPANLVVLDVDPFADHSDRLLNARVLTTIVDGAAVWSDPDSPQQM